MSEQDALTACRDAIAATDAAERPQRMHRYRPSLQDAVEAAEDEERLAARAYIAARDASVAGQVTEDDPGLHLSHTAALGVTACGRWKRGDMLSDQPTCPDCAAYLERMTQ